METPKPEPPSQPPRQGSCGSARPDWRQRAVLGSGILALVLACGLWAHRAYFQEPDEIDAPAPVKEKKPAAPADPHGRAGKSEPIPPPRSLPSGDVGRAGAASLPASFLDSFADKIVAPAEAGKGPALSNQELEKRFADLTLLQDRITDLANYLDATPPDKKSEEIDVKVKELDALSDKWDKEAAAFEKELRPARGNRPDDPVPQWLTGELLIAVRGDPELILPFFQRARAAGLDHARLWASWSRVQVVANQFEAGLQSALKAFERSGKDVYVWNALARAAFNSENFPLVSEKLGQAFPDKLPDWASAIRQEATELQALWQKEQEQRRIDQSKDDLPRVRLLVEHRKFTQQNGKPTNKIVSAPAEKVVLELFEDQAPNTVANFISLVDKKFYDGTKFFLSEPASLVAGGCPNTRNADPSDDGTGGPGYFIADEFDSPKARTHFRGALGMMNREPNTAGSQFFITLAPQRYMNGRFTVFGRVIKGQEVIDRITLGRTNLEVGPFGRIIPGDVLVRAEVIRKRSHAYPVRKIQ